MIFRRISENFVGKILKRRFPGVVIDPASLAPILSDLEAITFKSKGAQIRLLSVERSLPASSEFKSSLSSA